LAAFDHGDRIAVTTPGYPAYRNLMLAMGLTPLQMPARAAEGWMPSLEAFEASGEPLPDGMLIAARPTRPVS
ncbi:MAG: pyridoxal phosphate-dependent aminotransferase, partial [SAR116 cluster bacterium]|nr:pyridoxal phosphate-dependent aminotransferase [SAR116 cluster bacterium]